MAQLPYRDQQAQYDHTGISKDVLDSFITRDSSTWDKDPLGRQRFVEIYGQAKLDKHDIDGSVPENMNPTEVGGTFWQIKFGKTVFGGEIVSDPKPQGLPPIGTSIGSLTVAEFETLLDKHLLQFANALMGK